jgi:hypothetical protein
MSDAMRARAEILKLARLLRQDPEALAYLQDVAPGDLGRFREQVTDVLFGAHSQALLGLAAASKLLPVGVVATIGERAFGALLSARVAGLLEPSRAVEMAARLPTGFLADVAIELDPRRASELIARIPPEQVAAITRELIKRGEHVTMGRFVGHLGPRAIAGAVAAMDDSSLLQVAFVLETREGLEDLVELLPPERIDGIIDAAARDDLWVEVLDLTSDLSGAQASRLADAAAARDDDVLSSLIAAAQERDLWEGVLPLTMAMSESSRRRFAGLPAIEADGVLERVVAVARERQLWPQLLPLVPFLPDPAMDHLAQIVRGLGLREEEIEQLRASEHEPALREGVTRLVEAAGLDFHADPLP